MAIIAGPVSLNTAAVVYFSSLAQDIASYSIDAIVPGVDISFEDHEMSGTAVRFDSRKDEDVNTSNPYERTRKGREGGTLLEEYGNTSTAAPKPPYYRRL